MTLKEYYGKMNQLRDKQMSLLNLLIETEKTIREHLAQAVIDNDCEKIENARLEASLTEYDIDEFNTLYNEVLDFIDEYEDNTFSYSKEYGELERLFVHTDKWLDRMDRKIKAVELALD